MLEKESTWKKRMTILRDVVFVILFIATTTGWVRSATVNRTRMEEQVKVLSKEVENNTEQLEKINNILSEQQLLNGKIIQYMQTR